MLAMPPSDGVDQFDGRRRVVDSGLGQRVGDDDTRSVDTQMEFLPASFAVSSVFRSSPLPFAQDREPRAVDDEMHASTWNVLSNSSLQCGRGAQKIEPSKPGLLRARDSCTNAVG